MKILKVCIIVGIALSFNSVAGAVYVGNDPINNIDPTGKVLVPVGTQPYQDQVNKQLNQISKANPANAAVINQLQKSPHLHTIQMPSSKFDGNSTIPSGGAQGLKDAGTPGTGTGSTINFNPNNVNPGGTPRQGVAPRPPVVGLAHEIGHSEEMDSGNFQNDPITNYVDPQGNIPAGTTPTHEVNPIKTENRMRDALKEPKRQCYTIKC